MASQVNFASKSVETKISLICAKFHYMLGSVPKIRDFVDRSTSVDSAYLPILLQLLEDQYLRMDADVVSSKIDVADLENGLEEMNARVGALERKLGLQQKKKKKKKGALKSPRSEMKPGSSSKSPNSDKKPGSSKSPRAGTLPNSPLKRRNSFAKRLFTGASGSQGGGKLVKVSAMMTTASGYVVPETQGYFLDEFETEDPPVLSQRTVKTAEDECEREEKDVETITDDDDDEAEEGDNEEGKNDDDDDEDFEEEDRLRFKKKFDKGKGKGKENLKPAQKHRGV